MKTTIVPAQITTVEDKIVGSLSFQQVFLFIIALFLSTAIYLIFPTPMKLTLYKIPLMAISSILCLALAIRVQGKILFQWLILIIRYAHRPSFYVANKNDLFLRDVVFEEKQKRKTVKAHKSIKATNAKPLAIAELIKLSHLVAYSDKNIRVQFTKKGEVHATVS